MMIRRKFFELTRRAARSFNVAACALALASCATVTRIPYTQQEQAAAVIPGIPGGVTTNVLILPEALLVSGTPVFPPDARPKVYVVMNSKLAPRLPARIAARARSAETNFEPRPSGFWPAVEAISPALNFAAALPKQGGIGLR